MTHRSRKLALAVVIACFGLVFAAAGFAQAYPSKPIRLIVPYPPGGGTDTFARTVAAPMSATLGQPIVVDNKPGASTIIGAEVVARSAPDGYTVLLGDNATYAVNSSLYRKLPYDPLKDLAPVTLTARFALLLVVNDSVPAHNLKELVALAKSKPGRLDFGTPGNGTPHHLAMEMFEQRAGIQLTHVPYKGGAPATKDLVAGVIPVMFLDLSTALTHLKSGRIRALATASRERLPALPDVPTIAESGYPGYEAWAWQGFSVPAGTPKAVIGKLNAAYAKAAADPAIKQRLATLGADVIPSTPEEMGAYMRSETAKWAKIVKDAHLVVQ